MFDTLPLVPALILCAPLIYLGQMAVLQAFDRRTRMARLDRALRASRPERVRPRRPKSRRLLEGVTRFAIHISERFSVIRGGEAEASAELLRAAGFRGRDALLIYAFLKLLLPFGGAGFALLWFALNRPDGQGRLIAVIVILGSALALSKLPDALLKMRQRKRFAEARRAFPDMLELLVIASEAGLGFGPALGRVARDIQPAAPVLAFEIRQLSVELGVLPDRETAWARLSDRLPLSEVTIFANAMMQAERYGTPIASALRGLMRDQRAMWLLRIEEQAGRIPALMTVPLILFIMPALFIVLIGPAVLNILDNIMDGGFG